MSAPMPERINLGRISLDAGEPIIIDVKNIHLPPECQVEYVRADMFDALTARVKALEAALTQIGYERVHRDVFPRIARAALKQETNDD